MKTNGIKERHWNQITELCGIPRELDRPSMTLEQILQVTVPTLAAMLKGFLTT